LNIVLFGAPGAGKGTQSSKLVNMLNMVQISTGDLLRVAIKSGDKIGLEAKAYIDNGRLVPDEVVIALVEKAIVGETRNFILDGFPRTVGQALALNQMLRKLDLTIGKAFFLEVPVDILLGRLTGRRVCKICGAVYHLTGKPSKEVGICDRCGGSLEQRRDDGPEVISTRLNNYKEFTEPLKEFYREEGKFVEIDGNRDSEVVYHEICEFFK